MYKNLFGNAVSFLLLRIPHSGLEIATISSLPCQGKIARKAAVPRCGGAGCWPEGHSPLGPRTDPARDWATTGGFKCPPCHSPGPTTGARCRDIRVTALHEEHVTLPVTVTPDVTLMLSLSFCLSWEEFLFVFI